MRKVTLLFLMLTLVLFLSACSGKDKTVSVFISGDTIPLRYADNLTLVSYPDYTIATLRNPWDTLKTLHTYILVPHPNLYRRICPRDNCPYSASQIGHLFLGSLQSYG